MQALTKLKRLDDRINKGLENLVVVGPVQGSKPIPNFGSQKEFEEHAKSSLQSVQDLIDERDKIKRAIVNSNAQTYVEITGKKMTVAEAIEKKTSIGTLKTLHSKISAQLTSALRTVEEKNADNEYRLQNLLEAQFGKDVKGNNAESIESITKSFNKVNEWKLIDPINVHEKLETLFNDISNFEEEVDFKLGESNTITKIQV